jgi:hypothetical protein
MASGVLRNMFAVKFGLLDKKRKNAVTSPLTSREITTLLSVRMDGEPLFESIDHFYSDEYKAASETEAKSPDSDKIRKFRSATETEANLLYCDIHSKNVTE